MPKMKTRRAVLKRFKVTASGRLKAKRGKLRHNLTKKTTAAKRGYRSPAYVHESNLRRMLACLPGCV